MQITIGEYTTRNGCVATVLARDGLLFRGVVIIQSGLTQIGLWWDREGCVYFPEGSWSNESDYGMVFKTDKPYVNLLYSNETYTMLTEVPSPFDITEPKQMKEETKPTIVQKQRLIKLPDGSWVDPTTVAAITIIQPSVLDPECFRYWIAVIRTSITEININCDSREQAQKLADDLAEKVNSIK